jgi:hypothetical protein
VYHGRVHPAGKHQHYRQLLQSVSDEGERARILGLIAAEEAKEREALTGKGSEKSNALAAANRNMPLS